MTHAMGSGYGIKTPYVETISLCFVVSWSLMYTTKWRWTEDRRGISWTLHPKECHTTKMFANN